VDSDDGDGEGDGDSDEDDEGEGKSAVDEDPGLAAEMIAEILYGLYGDEALASLISVQEAFNALDHPRGPNGRFIPRGSPEARAAAREAVGKVLRGEGGVTAHDLASHLHILSVADLKALHREHGQKIPGKLRAELVNAVAARLPRPKKSRAKAAAPAKPAPAPAVQPVAQADVPKSAPKTSADLATAIKDVLPSLGDKQTSPTESGPRWGPTKYFLNHVYDSLKARHPDLDRATFNQLVWKAHQEGLVRLSRADMVQYMNFHDLKKSEIELKSPSGYVMGSFHFVELPPKRGK
jgi:hypothetical protein